MEIKATDVKNLRDMTGAGMMDAKKALAEAEGNLDKAKEILKERGATIAAQKAERVVAHGVVSSYVHIGNKIGVLVEVNVETDFVARDERFISFARDIAVHVAGMNPKYISADEVLASELAEADDKDAYIKEVCLVEQPYVKNSSMTVQQLVQEQVAHFKENIQIRRFVRFELGVVSTC